MDTGLKLERGAGKRLVKLWNMPALRSLCCGFYHTWFVSLKGCDNIRDIGQALTTLDINYIDNNDNNNNNDIDTNYSNLGHDNINKQLLLVGRPQRVLCDSRSLSTSVGTTASSIATPAH